MSYAKMCTIILLIICSILYLSGKTKVESFTICNDTIPHIIWIIWDSPIKDAPILITDCIENARRLNPGWKINVIGPSEWDTFVKDANILRHLRENLHSKNHLSDLLRVYLLKMYGGVYIDASIILLKSLDWIDTLPMGYTAFYRSDKWATNKNYPVLESWFIASPPQHIYITKCCELMLDALEKGPNQFLIQLQANKNIDYQKFMSNGHGEYHVFYYIMMYVWQSYPEYKVFAIPCPVDSEMCKYLYSNEHVNSLLHTPLTSQRIQEISDTPLLKLTGFNRRVITENQWSPVKNSILDVYNIKMR